MRRETFERKFLFHVSFKEGRQRDAVSRSLLALVSMIQESPNFKH